jgi:hypothetical protein
MPLELECYPVTARPPDIVPGRPQRAWMDSFAERHPYRCLPLSMANSTGWELLCRAGFAAEWNGGPLQSDIKLTPDRPNPDFQHMVTSHFTARRADVPRRLPVPHAAGVVADLRGTAEPSQGRDLSAAGLVETDWLPFPFTMNWQFTRPGRVRFERGEPFCFITPIREKLLDEFEPVQRSMEGNAPMRLQYEAWFKHRESFNSRLLRRDPAAVKEAWQRFYFKGELPDDTGPPPADHLNKRRLKPVRLGF